jgi:hypothetical protein
MSTLEEFLENQAAELQALQDERLKVQPRTVNLWSTPNYKPDAYPPARPGADDHLHIQSWGYRT